MQGAYINFLPRDYFGTLYEDTSVKLIKGENVCVSVLPGMGLNTFLNFFLRFAREESLFGQIVLYDPEVEEKELLRFVKDAARKNKKRKLFIIRFFEKIKEKREILEKLNSLRISNPEKLVFLVITDHSGVTDIENHFAKSTAFFSARYYISPSDIAGTIKRIKMNEAYYGWEIDGNMYGEIFALSGGVPRFIKHICKNVSERGMEIKTPERFLGDPTIVFELDYLTKIMMKLSKEDLQKLGLLDEGGQIKSKLLDIYFKRYKSGVVDQLYPALSDLEARIVTYLYENKEICVSIEKLGDLFEVSGHEFSLWAIYKLISRIKPKLKDNFVIENVRKRGYILRMRRV